jgi:hypothetical protein
VHILSLWCAVQEHKALRWTALLITLPAVNGRRLQLILRSTGGFGVPSLFIITCVTAKEWAPGEATTPRHCSAACLSGTLPRQCSANC